MTRKLSLESRSTVIAALLSLSFLFPILAKAQVADRSAPRITTAINESQLTILRGNTHPNARAPFDQGAAPDSLSMNRMLLVLSRSTQQHVALQTLLQQQQNPSSANFHRWLTPQQFGEQFGPSDQDMQTITSWLQSHGFQVTGISNGRTVIEFSGTAGRVRDAFHTTIHQYAVNGDLHWANSSDPQIPAALAPVVAGIVSLHNFPRTPMHRFVGTPSRNKPSAVPLYTVNALCGLSRGSCYTVGPYDFATIYNVLPLWNAGIDGTGQTIAIVSESDIYVPDFTDFRSATGLPTGNLNIIHNGPDPGILAPQPPETEADIDTEWAGAVAKGATIDLVVSGTTNTSLGVDLSAEYSVDNNLAPILSVSYGVCEFFLGTAGNQFYNSLWQQAAAEGITVVVAAGDSGSAVCDRNAGTQGAAQFGLSVSGFSSTPYNVAVGGTDFNDLQTPATYWNPTNDPRTLASVASYIPEMTWNDSCTNQEVIGFLGLATAEASCNSASGENDGFLNLAGGSGGTSGCTTSDGQDELSCSGGYPKPLWQAGLGVPNDGTRDVPDVSLFAADGLNANFYVMCEVDVSDEPCGNNSGTGFDFLPVGGTSISAPAFAGIMAMVDQKTGSRQGNANYILYQLAAQSAAMCNSSTGAGTNCIFYDVTNGTNAMPCAAGSPNCTISTAGNQVGELSSSNAPAYNAAAGYDLDTGLGSVNAANLVNKWANFSGSLKQSSTELVVNGGNAVNVTHGQAVSLAASVTPVPAASGTPTGDVSLVANTGPTGQEGVQSFALNNGSISSSTSELPGGSYAVTAFYPGDGTFAASSSSPGVNVTVNPEPSRTTAQVFTIDQNGNSTPFAGGTFGTPLYYRANVSGQSGEGVPTGSVNLTQTTNGTTTNFAGDPFSLNASGYVMTPFPGAQDHFPSPGTYSIAAVYSGDASFNANTSAPLGFSITKGLTTTYLETSTCGSSGQQPCMVLLGTQFSIGSYIYDTGSVFAPNPTGSFALLANGTQIGSPVTVDSSEDPPGALVLTSQLPLGLNSVTSQYSGDTNYVGSTSAPLSVDVVILTHLGLTPSSTSIAAGQSITFTAQVAAAQQGGPALSGSVQFSSNGSNLGGPVTLSNGQAQLTTTSLLVGLDEITAGYSGNADYSAAADVIPVTVNSVAEAFTIKATPMVVTITSPGQSGSTTLTFTGQNGFGSNGNVAITAVSSGLPSEANCAFPAGTTVNIASNGTATATLNCTTTAPSSAAPNNQIRHGVSMKWTKACSWSVASLLLLFLIAMCRRSELRLWPVALFLITCALAVAAIGCGGGGSSSSIGNPGTPTGTTSPTISVTINGITETVNITLNVQ